MGKTSKTLYCLRCQHRFQVDYEPGKVVERSCPNCSSNSVRAETAAAAQQRVDPGKAEKGA